MTGPLPSSLEEAGIRVRRGLEEARRELAGLGIPGTPIRGKLLRPMLAYAAVPPSLRPDPGPGFWAGALAIQMVHEASLLHDDILDGAPTRRGRATAAAEEGVARALVAGDHLLTAAYRVALEAGEPTFARLFVEAVERTVAGEIEQHRAVGELLPEGRYLEILEGKSGALFGCAMALAPSLAGDSDPGAWVELGRRVGRLYQMMDDALDYCPAGRRGKSAFQDYRQRKWTLPMGALGPRGAWDLPVGELHRLLFGPGGPGRAPAMRSVVERIRSEIRDVLDRHRGLAPADELLPLVLRSWQSGLETAVAKEEGSVGARTTVFRAAAPLADAGARASSFGRHATTFSFAARLFPPRVRTEVAGIYAFCRFSDDLADGGDPRTPVRDRRTRLEAWADLTRDAYRGGDTGIALLDRVMGGAARRGVPLRVIEALLEGVGWDLEPRRYADMDELATYTYRVAGTVGEWLTHVVGCHDEPILERARRLGHAMQLTNILRDVGEDLRMGRIYLPLDRMAARGISPRDLDAMASGLRPVLPPYRKLVEELLAEAEAAYDEAMEGVPALPAGFREAVAVAARTYRGIHREIRRNGYDNLTRRAFTRLSRKLILAGSALLDLRRMHRRNRRRAARLPARETPERILIPPRPRRSPA